MTDMRKRVTEDLKVIDKEYFPPGLRSRESRPVTLHPVPESKLSTDRDQTSSMRNSITADNKATRMADAQHQADQGQFSSQRGESSISKVISEDDVDNLSNDDR